MNELKQKLRAFIVDNFLFGADEPFADGDSLMDSGIVDSTGVLELIAYLEEQFGISVEDEELLPENLDSINNLAAFIGRKQAAPSTAGG